jgi:four helix bundle protein
VNSEEVFLQGFALLFCFIQSIIKYERWIFMADSPLIIKSKEFALTVIKVCKELRLAKCESALINQFLRSGTSIGANIREAFYAHGKADFVAKLQIALKECSESEYWIELLLESGYYNDKNLLKECIEVKRILIASINTAKGNAK